MDSLMVADVTKIVSEAMKISGATKTGSYDANGLLMGAFLMLYALKMLGEYFLPKMKKTKGGSGVDSSIVKELFSIAKDVLSGINSIKDLLEKIFSGHAEIKDNQKDLINLAKIGENRGQSNHIKLGKIDSYMGIISSEQVADSKHTEEIAKEMRISNKELTKAINEINLKLAVK